MAGKNYCLEHTKPLFCEQKLLNLKNLYVLHTFMLLFKAIKFHEPISIFNLFMLSNRSNSMLLRLPMCRLEASQQNFVYKSSLLWNALIEKLLNKCEPSVGGLIIPGSSTNSDMCTPKSIIRNKLKKFRALHVGSAKRYWDPSGRQWVPSGNRGVRGSEPPGLCLSE